MSYNNQMSVYGLVAKISLQDTMEYRVNFLLSTLKYSLMILFTALVWLAVEQANPAESYSRVETITYFFGAAILYTLSNFHPYEIEVDIKQGGLSRFLVKPMNPHLFYLVKVGAESFLATALKLIAFLPIAFALGFYFQPHLSQLLLFCLYLPVIYYVSFLLLSSISVCAFWFTEIYAVRWGLTVIFRLFSGILLPFDYFPNVVQSVLIYSPFPHLAYTPIRLLQGQLSIAEGVHGLTILLVWGVVLQLFNSFLWRRGIQEYEGTGI